MVITGTKVTRLFLVGCTGRFGLEAQTISNIFAEINVAMRPPVGRIIADGLQRCSKQK